MGEAKHLPLYLYHKIYNFVKTINQKNNEYYISRKVSVK